MISMRKIKQTKRTPVTKTKNIPTKFGRARAVRPSPRHPLVIEIISRQIIRIYSEGSY